jgi:UDP-N-acetylglucosamine--N-acetylmuramyl-(pentapeptide) pyrophosphoryl-undecaprenol N-acetylglucosamine transferase
MNRTNTRRPDTRIVVSAIGTGGHYFPAVIVAKELVERGAEVIVLVRKGYYEDKVAQMYGLKTFTIKVRAFYGKSLFAKIFAALLFAYSSLVLISLIKDARGIAFGGFGTLPLVIACLFKRRDFYLFEPNCKPGRATKFFASKARIVFLGLPLLDDVKGKLIITGVPIRSGFKESMNTKLSKKEKRSHTILFLGGSGGSYMVNKLALEMQEILPEEYRLVIISGRRDYEWVSKKVDRRTKVIPFTLTPWSLMYRADVIVARAGALAGYEILATRTPVIFIPFPYAIDDHQYHNAVYFAKAGNALVLREEQVTSKKIMENLSELLSRQRKQSDITWDAEKQIADRILGGTI